jgi:hypothetical protein
LYWLGTRKGEEDYRNPFKRSEIRVGTIPEDCNVTADFFEYRPSCQSRLENRCGILFCNQDGESSQFNLVDVIVKPTHYSLRYGTCFGMSDWNFEASVDGVSWDILHEARKDRHLLKPSPNEIDTLPTNNDVDFVSIAEERHRHTWEVNSSSHYKYFRFVSLSFAQLDAEYGIGRGIGGTDSLGPDGRVLFSYCLHGVGFELYGQVKSVKTTSSSSR